jgi:hypothetical protein
VACVLGSTPDVEPTRRAVACPRLLLAAAFEGGADHVADDHAAECPAAAPLIAAPMPGPRRGCPYPCRPKAGVAVVAEPQRHELRAVDSAPDELILAAP